MSGTPSRLMMGRMVRISGVDEEGGASGTCESGCHLAADVSGFSHAEHHYSAFARQQVRAGTNEGIVDTRFQGGHGIRLGADDRAAQLFELSAFPI